MRKSMQRIARNASVLAIALCSAACVGPTTPAYDAQFGVAVRQARLAQTLNPDAGGEADPLAGLDGSAGRAALERYHESFREPPRSFEVLNIGGSSVGGANP